MKKMSGLFPGLGFRDQTTNTTEPALKEATTFFNICGLKATQKW